MNLTKNQLLDVVFEDLTHEGAAVAKPEGFPIFVPHGLPGETAQIKIIKLLKGYGFGRLIETYEQSPERVEPACSVYQQCGGCQLQHLSYKGQLQAKEKIVRDALTRIGKTSPDAIIHPVIGMENPWHYRNKAQVPVGEKAGKLVAGFYGKRSHRIIDMPECAIQMEANDRAVQLVKEICQKHGIHAYNEETGKGLLRHILVRSGKATKEVMVVLVTRVIHFPKKQEIVQEIIDTVAGVESVVQNLNRSKTNVILGWENHLLWGQPVIYDEISGIKFAISANSFYQVNPTQTNVLYEKILDYTGLTGKETVIDAYCGVGTISLFLAQQAKKVYGIEVSSQAIVDAKKNAALNKINNTEFIVGKAEEVLPEWLESGIRADIIVVDPPRKGCDAQLLKAIVQMAPKKVVYVSCNPATLARDLRILEDNGYKTIKAQPIDLFPQTTHVECVVGLYKKDGPKPQEILEFTHFCKINTFSKKEDNSVEKGLIQKIKVSAAVEVV